jgi:inositol phosphorylceramide synthase catalytic subunit
MAADGAFPSDARSNSGLVALRAGRAPWHPALTFALYAAPFFLLGLGYEGFRRLVHLRGEVHVADLFALEARLFPVTTSEGTRALSDVIASHTNVFLDAIAGATYFLFMIEVFAVATYLFFRARPKMLELSMGFFLVNVIGWTLWLLYPAAPPWYVDMYGLGPAVLDAASNPAGLSRVDALLPFPLAASFYSKSANVFGAMPSLHVSYATLVVWVVFSLGGKLRWAAIAFALSMAFSAVYLRHHYILDVIAGALLVPPVALLGKSVATRIRRLIEVPA